MLFSGSKTRLNKIRHDNNHHKSMAESTEPFGHVEHSSGASKTACGIQRDGKHGPGWPKMSWKTSTERDRREWNLRLTLVIRMCGDQV